MVECSPATRAARVRFPDDAIFFLSFCHLCLGQNCSGGAGYRSRYLSHAKRALYHLSYAPQMAASDWQLVKVRTEGCFAVWMFASKAGPGVAKWAHLQQFLDSLVVRISACHVEGPGSIPGRGGLFLLLKT